MESGEAARAHDVIGEAAPAAAASSTVPSNGATAEPAPATAAENAAPTNGSGVRVYLELAGTTFTLAYVSLILVGMFHLWLRLYYFDLNALDYADLSDFLLAPARDPLIMLITIAPFVGGWIYYRATRSLSRKSEAWLDKAWPGWRRFTFLYGEHNERRAMLLASVLWAFAFSLQYETNRAEGLKKGDVDLVTAIVEGPGETVDTLQAVPIAQTSRFLVLWSQERETSDVIPLERLHRLIIPRARGFAADSAVAARAARVKAWDARANADNAQYDSVTKARGTTP